MGQEGLGQALQSLSGDARQADEREVGREESAGVRRRHYLSVSYLFETFPFRTYSKDKSHG